MRGAFILYLLSVFFSPLTYDCVQAEQRLSVFSSPHLTLDADSARVLAELTAAFYF